MVCLKSAHSRRRFTATIMSEVEQDLIEAMSAAVRVYDEADPPGRRARTMPQRPVRGPAP